MKLIAHKDWKTLKRGDYLMVYGDDSTMFEEVLFGAFNHLTKVRKDISLKSLELHSLIVMHNGSHMRYNKWDQNVLCKYIHVRNYIKGGYYYVYKLTEEEALLHFVVDQL